MGVEFGTGWWVVLSVMLGCGYRLMLYSGFCDCEAGEECDA